MTRKPLTTESELKSKIQEILPMRKIHLTEFLKGYRDRTKQYYETEHNDSPDIFRFMDPVLVISVYINSDIYSIVLRSTSKDTFDNKFFYLNSDELENFYNNPSHIREQELLKKAEKDDCLTIFKNSINEIYYNPLNLEFCKEKSYDDGCNEADDDYNTYKTTRLLKSAVESYKDILDFNILNLSYINKKVKDDEFKYEIEESAKAYKAELFLASSLTAQVSIETLLKVAIIKHLGKDKVPNHLYIYGLGKLLNDNGKIDDRLFKRIQAINDLRHGSAHSNTGTIEKWDAEQTLSLVRILVDALF
ncbi:HEPN domain-containing protein [Clostridium sp. 001]|uniref:HEPN domain-containing protein n=1 Tax=Clostridium sp. 001 TaxID=1970093 RepID=UPI001C2C8FE4|nr:HEPN domain-containing protein [Clostridium sp. 001]QXE19498.1 hypothetical protein B5S50_12085 [Clostridium sp. 001]